MAYFVKYSVSLRADGERLLELEEASQLDTAISLSTISHAFTVHLVSR